MPSTIWTHEEFALATDRLGEACGLTAVALEVEYVEPWHEWRITNAGFITGWDHRAGWRNATPEIHWLCDADAALEAHIIARALKLYRDDIDVQVSEARAEDAA